MDPLTRKRIKTLDTMRFCVKRFGNQELTKFAIAIIGNNIAATATYSGKNIVGYVNTFLAAATADSLIPHRRRLELTM